MKKKFFVITMLIVMTALCGCTPKQKEPEEVKPAYDIAGKTFYNIIDNYGHEDHSKLWLGRDGSFVLNDSYTDGVKDRSGKWTLNENVLTLEADDGKKIIFEVSNNETMKLKTSLEGSKSDDTFSTTEIKGSSVTPKDSGSDSKTDNTDNKSDSKDDKKDDGKSDSGNNNTPEPEKDIPCTGITSLYHNYWSYEGEKNWDLEIRPVPENTTDKITFKSNDENVVKIDEKGRATAVAPGKTTIEAKCGDKKITVNYEVRVKGAKASTWQCKNASAAEGYWPTVSFDASGNFDFTENLYSGMGHYKGTYKIEDGRYYCTVTDASQIKGFAGDSVKEIVFKIVDDETLKLKTNLCMSQSGDLFKLIP